MLMIIVSFVLSVAPVMAQEHSHEGEVGRYYEKWMRPDNRNMSCCHDQHCAVVEQVRREDGGWMMLRTKDQQWLFVPNAKIENYRDDARDSPDGRSHLCSSGTLVFCGVLGDGM